MRNFWINCEVDVDISVPVSVEVSNLIATGHRDIDRKLCENSYESVWRVNNFVAVDIERTMAAFLQHKIQTRCLPLISSSSAASMRQFKLFVSPQVDDHLFCPSVLKLRPSGFLAALSSELAAAAPLTLPRSIQVPEVGPFHSIKIPNDI